LISVSLTPGPYFFSACAGAAPASASVSVATTSDVNGRAPIISPLVCCLRLCLPKTLSPFLPAVKCARLGDPLRKKAQSRFFPMPVPPSTHGLKYPLFYGRPGVWEVGYDNGKFRGHNTQ